MNGIFTHPSRQMPLMYPVFPLVKATVYIAPKTIQTFLNRSIILQLLCYKLCYQDPRRHTVTSCFFYRSEIDHMLHVSVIYTKTCLGSSTWDPTFSIWVLTNNGELNLSDRNIPRCTGSWYSVSCLLLLLYIKRISASLHFPFAAYSNEIMLIFVHSTKLHFQMQQNTAKYMYIKTNYRQHTHTHTQTSSTDYNRPSSMLWSIQWRLS